MTILYVGWDVGGWNCDRNRKSRDGVCAIAGDLQHLTLVGTPWRGAIRDQMLGAGDPGFLLTLAGVEDRYDHYVLAIDTPLGWPLAVQALLRQEDQPLAVPNEPGQNPFVFRATERHLNAQGIATLSPVRDQIGSQATKGQAFLKCFGFTRDPQHAGTWRAGAWTAVEAYPAPCYHSHLETGFAEHLRWDERFLRETRAGAWPNVASDLSDALMCAVVAAVYHQDSAQLLGPSPELHELAATEGWIWVPADVNVEALQNERRGLGEENL